MTNLQFLAHVELPPEEEVFTLEALRRYQLERLNHTLSYAAQHSQFYKKRLEGQDLSLRSLEDLQKLPLTSPEDLTASGLEAFLCVDPGEIRRIVTLQTSGSEGLPKRIGFTKKDIFAIIHFFDFALQDITSEGKKILVCMPGKKENGLYDLLAKGADRFDAEAVYYGSILDYQDAADFIEALKPHCIIGIPMQMFGLARYLEHHSRTLDIPLENILLSSDTMIPAVKEKIAAVFGCPVYNHYGTTEMGYAAALECTEHNGMHLREAEFFFEVVDPDTGKAVPEGEYGELVFTTLRRKGMPLIRYRTGDRTRFMPGLCPCGTLLPRLEVPARINGHCLTLPQGTFTLDMLDQSLLTADGLLDYELTVIQQPDDTVKLEFQLWYLDGVPMDEYPLRNKLRAVGLELPEDNISFRQASNDSILPPGCRGKRSIRKI